MTQQAETEQPLTKLWRAQDAINGTLDSIEPYLRYRLGLRKTKPDYAPLISYDLQDAGRVLVEAVLAEIEL